MSIKQNYYQDVHTFSSIDKERKYFYYLVQHMFNKLFSAYIHLYLNPDPRASIHHLCKVNVTRCTMLILLSYKWNLHSCCINYQ